jgi:hypothetical protein
MISTVVQDLVSISLVSFLLILGVTGSGSPNPRVRRVRKLQFWSLHGMATPADTDNEISSQDHDKLTSLVRFRFLVVIPSC